MSLACITKYIIQYRCRETLSDSATRKMGSTANEFIIIAFCYERAGLVAVSGQKRISNFGNLSNINKVNNVSKPEQNLYIHDNK